MVGPWRGHAHGFGYGRREQTGFCESGLFGALTQPDRDRTRPRLILGKNEIRPDVLVAEEPTQVVWSSLWPERPDAQIRFDLDGDEHGTGLRWTLYVEEPAPSGGLTGRMCYRLNELINANLRYTFGQ